MRKRLAELFFGTESQLQIEIGRLEQSNKTLKNQRGRAYRELNKDYKALKRKYDEVLLEVAMQGRHYHPYHTEQIKYRINYDVTRILDLQDKIVNLQDKLDKATDMLQKAGLDCCQLVYTKIEEEKKQKIFELSQKLISVRERRKNATEEQARISKTLKELKGE